MDANISATPKNSGVSWKWLVPIVVSIAIAASGAMWGLMQSTSNAQHHELGNLITQETEERKLADEMILRTVDGMPDKLEEIVKTQAAMDAKLQIIMKRLGL